MAKGTPSRLAWLHSVRFRLLVIAILPMLVVMPLLLGGTFTQWSEKFDNLLIAKVNGELTIAHQYMASILGKSRDEVNALGNSAVFARLVQGGDETQIAIFLEQQRKKMGLDFLYLADPSGTLSSPADAAYLTHFANWPVVKSAMQGQARTEIDLFSNVDLSVFSEDLAKRARIDLVPTKAAVPTNRTVESRGMVVHTGAPYNVGGQRGALVGGILLNRNLDFIDTINDLVYPAASLTDGSHGTATLFLEDVRVSTNVRLFENVRALGTRVSAIVRSTVLDQGKVWLARAFVVNDWYISAYEPIVDSYGTRIGMLYVGFLDTPYRAAKARTLWITVAALLAAVILSVPIFLRWAGGIFRPLEGMLKTIGRVEAGELGARTGWTHSDDEIGQVASHLDTLLGQIQERDARLRKQAEELNDRVRERTQELSDANKRLEATTKQLVVSEKLAAIGEITAGIAHEINNPMAVIQGNIDVVRQELGPVADEVKTELCLIDAQIHSVTILVSKLLQFARPDEYSDAIELQDPDLALSDCLVLVQHLMNKVHIKVKRSQKATGAVAMNRTELQQVLINLIVNAIHAMPDGGELCLATKNQRVEGVNGIMMKIEDTGKGMPPEVLDKIFDPFFTTKQREGTGLGLSISQTIVTRYGGMIWAKSTPGVGTEFFVWFPSSEG
ncbi:MAG: cache domain-containing protein [Rhodobacterales bacterium]